MISEASFPSISENNQGNALGRIVQITVEGEVFVRYTHDLGQPRSALLLNCQSALCVGDTVLLAFDGDDSLHPIVVGSLANRLPLEQQVEEVSPLLTAGSPVDEVSVDGKTITFNAKEQIVLRCGESSITLRKDGKILVKGVHIVSRAQQTNRIKGGSVAIN